MAGSQIPTSVTILNSLHGFMGLSLKEYSTSAAASIASGSVVEIAGAFFTFVGDEAINASSWTAITTGTTAYIALTPSGTAGSQVVTADYTATAPTWRDDFQGWYASAASIVRIIGSVYKAEATNYGPKFLFTQDQKKQLRDIEGLRISCGSSLTVAGPASFASSISIAGSMKLTGIASFSTSINVGGLIVGNGYSVKNSIHTVSTTHNAIFDAVSPSIPVTGQSIIVNGVMDMSGTQFVVSRMTRVDSTHITVYGAYLGSTLLAAESLVDGSANNADDTSIAW